MERACHSLNEIRYYFEFHQLQKYLLKQIEQHSSKKTDSQENSGSSSPHGPNIIQNIQTKSQQALGSLKLIEIVMQSLASVCIQIYSAGVNNEAEEYTLFKMKVNVKTFLSEIHEYLKKQLSDMIQFKAAHGRNSFNSFQINKRKYILMNLILLV
jgi:hypothetical protein